MTETASGSLENGATLGPYTIVARLGAGGMGEVYRAHDHKLNRDVAIKVVRPGLAGDPDGHARFQREARILASLNHPRIAAIYGLDESAGRLALVMELVDGPTLADRLRFGALPPEEATRIARQIAEGLEYAHERGIVHRDLKPGNVKVTADGGVKILDFGLAKALADDTPATRNPEAETVTHPMTEAGLVLGTPAYMSPEQAAGRPIDRRTDVWAFGCVLYEMLTGSRPFDGATTTETLAAVMRDEPDWSRLPAITSPAVPRVLRRCLQKDPRQRLQAIGDARIELDEATTGSSPLTATSMVRRAPSGRLALELAGAGVVAAVAAFVAWSVKPVPAVELPVRSFTVVLPPGQRLAALDRGTLALSADGTQLAYVAAGDEGQQIYVRAMDSGETTPVAGTKGATTPCFSPDGQWLGFVADGKLKKVRAHGGALETLTVVTSDFGTTWTSPRQIVYAPSYSELEYITADPGGTPSVLTHFDGEEASHAWPSALADGTVLFASYTATSAAIAMQDAAGAHRTLVSGNNVSAPSYVSSGHLAYREGTDLMAVPFDLAHHEVRGDAVQVLKDVLQYAVSANGSLAYAAGSPPSNVRRLVWVTRTGASQVIDERAAGYYQPRLEPVLGRRITMDLNGQVWGFDFATHNFTPFTFGDRNQHAIWTRDGKQIVFMTQKNHTWQLSVQASDGSGRPEAVASDPGLLDIPYSVSPDGDLSVIKASGTAESELWILPIGKPPGVASQAQRLFSVPIADADAGPAFSPDGRWLAYAASDTSGRQIFVQAFPGPGDRHQVSIDGGNEPLWNPSSARQPLELFYRNGDDMMAVDITTQPAFVQGKPQRLFQGAAGYQQTVPNYVRANYDVSADGQRFLMLQPAGQANAPVTEIHIVLNWAQTLTSLVPARK